MTCVETRFVKFEAEAVPATLVADATAMAAATLGCPGLTCTHEATKNVHTVTFVFAASEVVAHDPRLFAAAVQAAVEAVDCTRPAFELLAELARCDTCTQLVPGGVKVVRCTACARKATLACPPIPEEGDLT